MTLRELYDAIGVELNKVEAPSILLEDFNYFVKKGITQFANKSYNYYDVNQQTSDDLSALKRTIELVPTLVSNNSLNYYECILPDDYFHILSVVCSFNNSILNKDKQYGARRLPSDIFPVVMNNFYSKPSIRMPYYKIDKQNNKTRIELRYGNDKNYKPNKLFIEYLKIPNVVNLTEDQLYNEPDVSDKLEFPEYINYEIINIVFNLILENSSNPRLQTSLPLSQSIMPPMQSNASAQANEQAK